MDTTPILNVRDQLPSLKQHGAAVEYYPGYINLAPDPHGVDALLVSLLIGNSISAVWIESHNRH